MQVEPVQHRPVARVAEEHAVEPDVASHRLLELGRMPGLEQLGLGLEHLGDPPARGERLLHRRNALAEHP